MAKIVEDVVVIKLSKIVKDNESDSQSLVTEDLKSSLEQVAQELVGSAIIVELVEA